MLISTNVNGALLLSGRAALILAENMMEYTLKVCSTVTLNRIMLMIKDRNDPPQMEL